MLKYRFVINYYLSFVYLSVLEDNDFMNNFIHSEYFSHVKEFLCQSDQLIDSELKIIFRHLYLKKFNKGDYILKPGEVETAMSYIIKGKVHQYSIIDSKQVTERVSLAGSAFCSYVSYVQQVPSNQIQGALSDTTLVGIAKKQIEHLLRVCPQFCRIMLKKLESIHFQREIRAYILQHKSALDRYKLFMKMDPLSDVYQSQVSQKYIASYIGFTPQAFSKAKSSFLRQGHF